MVAGTAVALLAYDPTGALRGLLLASLGGNLLLILAERFVAHPTVDGAMAARLITEGPWQHTFWGGVVVFGTLVPVTLLLLSDTTLLTRVASVLALAGLFLYEDVWVKAGQAVPLS